MGERRSAAASLLARLAYIFTGLWISCYIGVLGGYLVPYEWAGTYVFVTLFALFWLAATTAVSTVLTACVAMFFAWRYSHLRDLDEDEAMLVLE